MFVTSGIFFMTVILLVLAAKKLKRFEKPMQKIKHKLMWSSVFQSMIQTFLPTCILVFTQWHKKDQNFTEYVQCVILAGLPIFFYFFLRTHKDLLDDEKFTLSYGTMYQNLNTSKNSVLYFNSFFMLRRIAVAVSTTSLDSLLITNIYVNIFTSLFLLKFYLDTKPMHSNSLLIINESFTLLSFYCMFLFSDFIPDIE